MTDSCVNSWMFLLADRDREHLGLEPRALAPGHGPEAHVLLDPLALLDGPSPCSAAAARRRSPRTRACTTAGAPSGSGTGRRLVAVRAEEEELLLLLGSSLHGLSEVDLVALRDPLDDGLVERRVADRPGNERAVGERARGSGTSSSGSISCCEPRPVQRGHAPCGELNEKIRGWSSGSETPCSGQANCSEKTGLAADHVDHDEAAPRERRLDGLRQPRSQVVLHHEPVDDDVDRVLELLVENELVLEQPMLAVDLHAREAVRPQLLEHLAVLALAVADDRRVDREPRALGQREDLVDDRLDRSGRRSAAARPGSAGGRRARTAGAGSRRSR